MPVNSTLVAARLGKPGDVCYPVAHRDQTHPTVSTGTQANTRHLAKWYVDHAAHSQPVFIPLAVSCHGRGFLRSNRFPRYIGKTDSTMRGARSSWTQVQCPLWVKSRHFHCTRRCPLCPQ